jgi:hypothetical protein
MNIKVSEVSGQNACFYCKRKFDTDQMIDNTCPDRMSSFPLKQLIVLQDLNLSHTLILNLYLKHNFSMSEISSELKINYNTVRTVISRFKKHPKDFLNLKTFQAYLNNVIDHIESEIISVR